MRKVLITESSLRDLLRELMNSHAPIFPNPVVDPQAAETDPTNQNFVPSDKTELMSALKALVDPVDDERVPQVYVAVKDAIEKEEAEMKDTQVESIIRRTIRKILKESFLNEQGDDDFKNVGNVDQDGNPAGRVGQYTPATIRRDMAAKAAHSTPVFMVVRRSAAETAGVPYVKIPSVDDVVKVDFKSLEHAQKQDLIKANRQEGSLSQPLPAWAPRPESPVQNRPAEKLVSSFYEAQFKVPKEYINAYRTAYEELAGAVGEEFDGRKIEPYEIIETKNFKEMFEAIAGISWNDCIFELGQQALDAISERLNSQLDSLDDLMIDMSDVPVAKTKEDEKRAYAASDVTMKTLQDVANELDLSVSMIKKVERTALGKFAFGIAANIGEFIK